MQEAEDKKQKAKEDKAMYDQRYNQDTADVIAQSNQAQQQQR